LQCVNLAWVEDFKVIVIAEALLTLFVAWRIAGNKVQLMAPTLWGGCTQIFCIFVIVARVLFILSSIHNVV